ncbi:hypothetical protein AB1K84_00145 [Mesobacillus foraminis]|uniref:hypothetical protein n=1 Tax=Mesobacillus foraminis TaxID=279826 RepID=UPI0039A39ABD
MIKNDNYTLVFSIILFFTLLLATALPVMVRAGLIIAVIGFLFPLIRRILAKNLLRKMKVACYSALAYTIGLFLVFFLIPSFQEKPFVLNEEFFLFLAIILLFSAVGNFAYGLPVSLLAESISIKYSAWRVWVSGFIHIGFGVAAFFVAPGFWIPAIICSLLFFTFDEITRKKSVLIGS